MSAKAIEDMVVLTGRVYRAHDAGDVSDVEALIAEAKRLDVKAPDVLRRLADLKRWKKRRAR